MVFCNKAKGRTQSKVRSEATIRSRSKLGLQDSHLLYKPFPYHLKVTAASIHHCFNIDLPIPAKPWCSQIDELIFCTTHKGNVSALPDGQVQLNMLLYSQNACPRVKVVTKVTTSVVKQKVRQIEGQPAKQSCKTYSLC